MEYNLEETRVYLARGSDNFPGKKLDLEMVVEIGECERI